MNSDGTNQTRLTFVSGFDFRPSFSPDGTKIAFETTRTGNREIFVMDVDGGNPVNVTNDSAGDFDPAFGPDGRIYFRSSGRADSLGRDIYSVNANGTGLANVTSFDAADDEPHVSGRIDPDADGDGLGDACDDSFDVPTPVGSTVVAVGPGPIVTYSSVEAAGTTSFVEIFLDQGDSPAGFSFCPTCKAWEITTNASYTPPVTVCLPVPQAIPEAEYSALRLMHGENGSYVDRTSGHMVDGQGVRYVCGQVSSLSPFALATPLAPTAAPVSISGRVATAMGRGISNARVTITNPNGERRLAVTNTFGYYAFADVPAGESYVIEVEARRYTFARSSLLVSANENLTGVDFVARER
jgi:hypothetical protein